MNECFTTKVGDKYYNKPGVDIFFNASRLIIQKLIAVVTETRVRAWKAKPAVKINRLISSLLTKKWKSKVKV